MILGTFLAELFENGRPKVPPPDELAEEELREVERVLVEFERHYRPEMPGTPPALVVPPARWAAVAWFRACQFLVFRDVDAELVTRTLATECPAPRSPSTDYSVDLVFRFLPDLLKLARAAAASDRLVVELMAWARRWPLSSVGAPGVGAVTINSFADDPSLLALYADRILTSRDASRLSDGRVRQAVRQALGMFPDLCPPIAAAMDQLDA